ncbi:MAG: ketopantoate reductase family protein [Thermomicrobiales bacterium]
MRFVIVGPGALGSVIGAILAQGNHDVSLLGRPSPHLRALRETGLHLTSRARATERVMLPASDDASIVAAADAIVILVKTGDTTAAMNAIKPHVRMGQTVLTLQNGLGNAERIGGVLDEGVRVLAGVTSHAAHRTGPGAVVHAGEGPTLIGPLDERDAPMAAELAQAFTDSGLPTASVPDIERWIWQKAAVNAAINGLTALGEFPNGAIAANPDLLDAAEIIAEEAASVARARGFELGGMRRIILETATATANNRSSMLQDLENGRRTEVAAIHGAILAAGAETGIATPAIQTIAALIAAKEQSVSAAAQSNG